MRVNVYAEEMTDRVEIISKEIDGQKFTGVRFYLYLPTTLPRSVYLSGPTPETAKLHEETGHDAYNDGNRHVKGPFIHRPGDDDSAAVTFWGKQDLRIVLKKALAFLDAHYERTAQHRDRSPQELSPQSQNCTYCGGPRSQCDPHSCREK